MNFQKYAILSWQHAKVTGRPGDFDVSIPLTLPSKFMPPGIQYITLGPNLHFIRVPAHHHQETNRRFTDQESELHYL